MTVSVSPIRSPGWTVRVRSWPRAAVRLDGSSGTDRVVTTRTCPDTGSTLAPAAWAGVSVSVAAASGRTSSSRRVPSTVIAALAAAPGTRAAQPRAARARSRTTVVRAGGFSASQASISAATGSPSDAATIARRAVRTMEVSGLPVTRRVHGPRCCPWATRSRCSIERARFSSPANSAASARLTCSSIGEVLLGGRRADVLEHRVAEAGEAREGEEPPRTLGVRVVRDRPERRAQGPGVQARVAAHRGEGRHVEVHRAERDDREALVLGDERFERRLVDRRRRRGRRPRRAPGSRARTRGPGRTGARRRRPAPGAGARRDRGRRRRGPAG